MIAVLLGCGGNGATNDLGTSAQTIGATGGQVTSPGGASVQVPAGALTSPMAITITAAPGAPPPASVTVVGTPITLAPEGQQFSMPVTVTVPVATNLIPTGATIASVVIETAPVGSSNYTTLSTTVVDATHVSATVAHFSTFVPAVPSGGSCATNADCKSGICVSGVCH
jgi:hypothetical protein